MFLLRSGMAKVRTITSDGEEVVLSVLGEGELFDEMAMLDGTTRLLAALGYLAQRSSSLRNPATPILPDHTDAVDPTGAAC